MQNILILFVLLQSPILPLQKKQKKHTTYSY